MYSNTPNGMLPYSPKTYEPRNDYHLHAPNPPSYSYSPPLQDYPYSHGMAGVIENNSSYQYDTTGYAYTTVPCMPTPDELSRYEYNKTPSGQVIVTEGNQTVEFFSGVANVPPQQ